MQSPWCNKFYQVMNALRRLIRNQEQAVVVVDDNDDNGEITQTDNTPIVVEDDDVVPTQPIGSTVAAADSTTAHGLEAGGAVAQQSAAAAAGQPPAGADASIAAAEPDAGSTCTICLELLFEQGSHRPAALKCGHIFGNDCIREWLQCKARCPQCNQKAKARDITLLYNLPKAIAAGAGEAELEAKLREAEQSRERERRRAAQLEAELQAMQRQLAMRQQQQPQLAIQVTYGTGAAANTMYNSMPWQHQAQYPQVQQQPFLLQQQQQQHQQHSVPLPVGGQRSGYQQHPVSSSIAQPPAPGQKRSWAQAALSGGGAHPPAPTPPYQQQQRQRQQPAAGPADDSIAATSAAESAAGSGDECQLTLLPVRRQGAAAAVGVQMQRQQICGSFMETQQYKLENSRCFHLDVPGALLLVGEKPNANSSRLRKISLLCPASPSYLALPAAAGVVRGLAAQQSAGLGSSYGSSLLAVATEKAGLQLVSISTHNVVQTVPVQSPVWSVAWSPQYEHQLLMGLDKGRTAVADLRKPSGEMLLSLSNSAGSRSSSRIWQPLHSLVTLQDWQLNQLAGQCQTEEDSSSSSTWSGPKPEAIVACTGGVYSWSRSQPDTFNLLLPSSVHGGTCESIALAPDGSTLAVSFRAPLNSPFAAAAATAPSAVSRGMAVHLLAQLGMSAPGECAAHSVTSTQQAGASATHGAATASASQAAAPAPAQAAAGCGIAAALQAAKEQLLQETVLLGGHRSCSVMTHGCFLNQLPGLVEERLLFASADELTCTPRLWGCSSGSELLHERPWVAMQSPVLQVAAGVSGAWGVLLGAMSERSMTLYNWAQEPDS